MGPTKIAGLFVMLSFYAAYFCKMFMQRRQGVQTDQIGRGTKPKRLLRIERVMKVATYAIVPVELASIFDGKQTAYSFIRWIGLAAAALGVLVFIIAMLTMGDSWRAGIPERDKTELITDGIYRFSRNPAFLGFDLMYIGLLVSYFNLLHLIFVVFAICMLHLQILQEEKYLTEKFGEPYLEYKKHTGRYFIM